jgi:uncharacterized protein (AIM24 family)
MPSRKIRQRAGDLPPPVAPVPAPAVPGVPVPEQAGRGDISIASTQISTNSTITSTSVSSGSSGLFKELGGEIVNLNGYDVLKFKLAPQASVITNQETLSYMDGGLVTGATMGSGSIFSALFRSISGASFLQNSVSNPTQNTLKLTLSPRLQGSLTRIDIQPGETWRVADGSFVAATSNLQISGNINIFSNFRMMFVGENLTYTTATAHQGSPGSLWISSYGGIEKHEIDMGTGSTVPLFINNGCFLSMLDNNGAVNFWNDYVSVGTANGLFSAMFTQLGWVMKIQDTVPPRRPGPLKLTVLTQSLNPHNLEKYIANIAQKVVERSRQTQSSSFLQSGVGTSASSAVLGTGAAVVAGTAAAAVIPGTAPAPAPALNTSSASSYDSAAQNTSAAPAPEVAAPEPAAAPVNNTYGSNYSKMGGRSTRKLHRRMY